MSDWEMKPPPQRGRGATLSPANRYQDTETVSVDDGWKTFDDAPSAVRTTLSVDSSRSIIARNQSPDIPFDRSINPYRGCEHGCIYCYARPSHAWLGLSPGLDFESRLFYKPEAADLLRSELRKRGYRPAPLALGANTDAYQPAERSLGITRTVLEVLAETRHPVTLVTKSALVERDLDLLADMARDRLVSVAISLTTLDPGLARRLEPRASTPRRRLETIAHLAAAGVPVGVMAAPVIPAVTDTELEKVLAAARGAGAVFAGYVLLRLPLEVAPMFRDWLEHHYPEKSSRILSMIQDTRGGRKNDGRFVTRMRGVGPVAHLIAQRFALASKRLGFSGSPELACHLFRPPEADSGQLDLL